MKILFSPSETKKSDIGTDKFSVENLIFGLNLRDEFLSKYDNFLQNSSTDELSSFFGIKKLSDIKRFKSSYNATTGLKAIKRYTGVAYDALGYQNLDQMAKNFINENVLIFSNLYGVLRAGDIIPEYKFKQGASFLGLKPEIYYAKKLSQLLDEYLKDDEILDLRAGFYDKFYKIKTPYVVLKFIKDKKVISHWAKFYRGVVLREVAKKGINSLDDFQSLELQDLSIKEIKKHSNKTEITYEIG